MIGGMGSAVVPDLSQGGEIDGDLTITGDFKVEGAGSFAFDEIIEGTMQIVSPAYNGSPDVDFFKALKLQIKSDSYWSQQAQFKLGRWETASGSHARSSLQIALSHGAVAETADADVNVMTLRSDGKVGINTETPSYALDVHSSLGLQLKNGSNNTVFHIPSSSGYQIGTQTNNHMSMWTNNTERIRILNTGAVGINTSSPQTKLHVIGGDGTTARFEESVSGKYSDVDGNSFVASHELYLKAGAVSNQHIYFQNGSSTNGIINSSGNWGIGTTSPGEKLAVADGNIEAIMTTAGSGIRMMVDRVDTSDFAGFETRTGGTQKWFIGLRETSDENLHFFSPTGGDKFVLDTNSRISLSNNDGGDNSNTVFGALSGTSLASGGIYNVLVGANTGASISTGDNNVALGTSSLRYGTGSNNIAIGFLAHYGSGSGSNNVSIGSESARALTSGANNVAVGYKSLYAATTAYSNVVIGKDAMEQVPAGQAVNSCVAIGLASLKGSSSTTTGINGTISIGLSSLQSLTTGAGNLAIGLEAGKELSDNDRNIAIGYESLYNTNKAFAEDNIFIGYESGGGSWAVGSDLATGTFANNGYDTHSSASANGFTAITSDGATNTSSNTDHIGLTTGKKYLLEFTATLTSGAIPDVRVLLGAGGSSAGLSGEAIIAGSNIITFTSTTTSNTTIQFTSIGNTNYTIADLSLKEASGASSVVAIGNNAMEGALDNQVGTVAIGHNALTALTTGGGNLAIGYTAGSTISSASFNTFVGYESGVGDGTASSRNTGLGYRTLKAFTSGASNTAIGNEALTAITTGSNNVAVGSYAGTALNGGHSNVIIGEDAYKLSQNGHGVVAIGFEALNSVGPSVSSDQQTVAVGYQAGATVNGGTNNTLLGYKADVDTATTSNQTVIGHGGVFKFQSKEYTCDHASDDDNDVASSEASPIKIPAYSVIKSVSAIISQLANISTYNLAVFYSNDTSSPADDSGLTSGVELIGASASTSKSGHTGNAEDMVCGGGSGLVKKSFYNGFDGNGLHVGNGDRYIHLVNAGTGNGDTDPSTSALVKVLVEYVGLD